MTSSKCLTGTDRVAEVAKKIKSNIYVNVQGDEPTINPKDIKKIIKAKIKYPNHVICGYDMIPNSENPSDINFPKVVINKNDELRMWAYSRIDTVKNPEILNLVRSAGIKWLCLGIESGNKNIRLEVSKGKFEDVDVKKIVQQIHDADIEVMANYIFGLPGDDKESMRETFDLSKELCTSGWNTYAAMALPGSKLYKLAVQNNQKLPENYEGYSFHSYNTQPLPTEKLEPYEILSYRDKCFEDYHNDASFLKRIEKKYGKKAAQNIVEMSKIKLKRRIIEESNKD